MSFQNIFDKYGNITHFLEYASLISSLNEYLVEPLLPLPISVLLSTNKGCRSIYDRIIGKNICPTSIEKWKKDIESDGISTNILNLYKIHFKCTKDSTLQWFQTRINHRILGTNHLLEKMNLKEDNTCSYCRRNPETLKHLFYECEVVKEFWTKLETLIKTKCPNLLISFTIKDIIFGNNYFNEITNTVLILARYFIFKNRETNLILDVDVFKKYIMNRFKIDEYNAIKNMNIEKNMKLWTPLVNLL